MKKGLLLCMLIIVASISFAQKKMLPVTQSSLTGIALPAGSMQDKRMLSVSAANALMEMESKKAGRTILITEVLVIPSTATSGFDEAKLAKELSGQGWTVSVNEDDKKYAWLQKGNESILMYFSSNPKESNLYFAIDDNSHQNPEANSVSADPGKSQNQHDVESFPQYKPVEFSDIKEIFDLITYSAPKDWKKEETETIVSYNIVNKLDKTWCEIGIVKSTNSKGSIEQDFKTEWVKLAATPYKITDPPQTSAISAAEGWKIQSGSGQFTFNNAKAVAILTTFSGFGRCVSIIATTGSQRHLNDIESFISHIELKNPGEIQGVNEEVISVPAAQASGNGFAFTTTNFDDGWKSTVQDDWVQVTKGNIKVLIHYPNKQADAYNSVLLDGLKNAWNLLVAPRYSYVSNFEFKPITGWQSIEFAEADAIENATGKSVHIVLFKMNYSNGSGKYMEFLTPDKRTYEQEFGPYHQESYGWEKVEAMTNYNKFAVSASDLSGKWTSDFSGAIQYVNAYTGLDAGMDTHASNENFQFSSENQYNWDLGVASGAVGNIKFQSVKSSGRFSMAGNWQITFSDIEGKARTYDTYFSCIKGLRILWLDNKPFAKSQ